MPELRPRIEHGVPSPRAGVALHARVRHAGGSEIEAAAVGPQPLRIAVADAGDARAVELAAGVGAAGPRGGGGCTTVVEGATAVKRVVRLERAARAPRMLNTRGVRE